jgi:hypothetical protein
VFFVVFYFLAVIWGVRSAYYWQPSVLDLILQLMLMITISCWAISDSIARGKPIPTSARVWYFFFAIILVPVYVIETRRWRGVGWVALHAFAWFAAAMSSFVVISLLTALIRSKGH